MIKGTARITNDDRISTTEHKQSTHIPSGMVVRLTNPTTSPLMLIEVQSGPYLEENDIVRFDEATARYTSAQRP